MANVQHLQPAPLSGFKTSDIQWQRLQSSPHFDYPIDYWIAVLGTQPAVGRADFLIKWEPDCYCHFHKHLGSTVTLVLEGEHHVVEQTATETVHKTRTAGHYARNPGGEVHMEYAGPQGAVVLFSMQAGDGRLFEILDKDENVLALVTVDDLASGRLPA